MNNATEKQIKRWVARHFPYVELVRTDAGFDTYGFRYKEELDDFRTQFEGRFEQFVSTTPAGRFLPRGFQGRRGKAGPSG